MLGALLAFFVLPAFATSVGDPQPPESTTQHVTPEFVAVGGSNFSCSAVGSPGASQFQINNPRNGNFKIQGTPYSITLQNLRAGDTMVDWVANGGMLVLDLGVKGGSQHVWYRYRSPRTQYGSTGTYQGINGFGVGGDVGVHAPLQSPTQLYSISYMTFCYSPTTSISGRVFSDTNGNGVDNSGEPGLVRTVNLYLGGATTPTATTPSSSSDGSFSFANQTVGSSYKVCVSDATGFNQTVPVNTDCTTSGEAPGGSTFTLASGGVSNLAFGFQQVGGISGRVFNDLNGNATDNTEPGLSGRTVNAYLGSASTPTATTSTGTTGGFSFAGLAPGTYKICAASSGWTQTAPAPLNTNCSATGEGRSAASVTLTAGGSGSASFGFYDTATISGSVLDSTGSGLSRTVNLYLDGATSSTSSTTSTGGSFSFPTQRVGASYKVCVVNVTGWQQTEPASGAQSCTGSGEASNPATGTVATGGSTATTFRFVQLASVGGRVFNDANGDGSGASDTGIGTAVSLFRSGLAIASTTSSSVDGSFSFSGIPVGSGYTICVATPSPGSWRQTAPSPGASCPAGFAANGAGFSLTAAGITGLSLGFIQQATIGGTIFDDANGNGSQDAGEGGIGGRDVFLYTGSNTTPVQVTTQSDGSFTFGAQDVGQTYKICSASATGQVQTYPKSTTTNSAACSGAGETTVGWAITLTSNGAASLGFGSVAAIAGSCLAPFGVEGYEVQLAPENNPCVKAFIIKYEDTDSDSGGLASLQPVAGSGVYAMVERITWTIPVNGHQFNIKYDDILPYLNSETIPMLYCKLDPRNGTEFGLQAAYYASASPGAVIPNYPTETSCIIDEDTSTLAGKYIVHIYSSIDGLRNPGG